VNPAPILDLITARQTTAGLTADRPYAGHTDKTGSATTTYIKADLQAVVTGQPHPLATSLENLGNRW
jgi:hypothetical protein